MAYTTIALAGLIASSDAPAGPPAFSPATSIPVVVDARGDAAIGGRPSWGVAGREPSDRGTEVQIKNGPDPSASGNRTLGAAPAAFAAGSFLLLAILALGQPALAGFLAILSSVLAVIVIVPFAGTAAGAAMLVPVMAAAGVYAVEPRRRIRRFAPAIIALAFAVTLGVVTACAAVDVDWRIATMAAGASAAALATLGLFGGLAPPWSRARARSAATGGVVPARALIVDELVPGRSAARLTAGDLERERLATEMHSGVMPDLSAVIRDLESDVGRLDTAKRLRSVAAELRELMSARRNVPLEVGGLLGGLEFLAERIEERDGVVVDLNVCGAVRDGAGRPPHEVENALYRIVEEALDNAITHARARRITVGVTLGRTHVTVDVADDGVGLAEGDVNRAVRSGHLGITDMCERARLIGARLTVTSGGGCGTHVTVKWSA